MDRSKAPAQRWFDRRARSYEGGATSRWRDPVQRASLAAFDLTPDDLLLDVGCGTGAASRGASGVAKFVVGVDLSSGMIRQATDWQVTSRTFGSSSQIPSSSPSMTASSPAGLCSDSFHHHPDPLRAVREMARVLASDGRLVIGDACSDLPPARIADAFLRRIEPGHIRLYRSSELGSFLQRAGSPE